MRIGINIFLCLVLSFIGDGFCKIRYASIFGDHMVLQRAPKRAIIWGYADVLGDSVSVLKNGVNLGHTTVKRNSTGFNGIWKMKLPPEGHPGPYSITVKSSEGEVTINDVMFGDVWLCSGQSNMQFTMREVNNSVQEIENSINYTNVRMFFTKLQQSTVPLREAPVQMPWIAPTKGIIDSFSALCFLFGKHVYDQYKVPVGLIESNWGGTPIEVWSSSDAMAACPNKRGRKRWAFPTSASVLWNSMISPFLNMTIYGAIWYQGESNAGKYDLYSCQFPAMISDWRQKFHNGSEGETSDQFPFGFVQLAPYRPVASVGVFPFLRWAQTANVGYVPNQKMPNTFMATAADLPDFRSPSGAIHPRYKQDIADRLFLAARNVAYGEQEIKFQGPFPTGLQLDASTNILTVEYDNGKDVLQVNTNNGFEICCSTVPTSGCSAASWVPETIVGHGNSSILLDASGCSAGTKVAGVRYIWKESPCLFKQCAIYSASTSLPAPPFIYTGGIQTSASHTMGTGGETIIG